MNSHPSETPHDDLEQLAATIVRSGLRTPTLFIIDIVTAFDIIGSQMAIFSRPFLNGGSWERYAAALAEPGNWRILRQLVDKHD
jgi:hypothetical protein